MSSESAHPHASSAPAPEPLESQLTRGIREAGELASEGELEMAHLRLKQLAREPDVLKRGVGLDVASRSGALDTLRTLARHPGCRPAAAQVRSIVVRGASLECLLVEARLLKQDRRPEDALALLELSMSGSPNEVDARFAEAASVRDAVMDHLAVLAGLPRVSKLLRRVRERLNSASDHGSQNRLCDLPGWADQPDGIVLPPGTSVSDGALVVDGQILTHTPVFVTGRCRDIETGHQELTVSLVVADRRRSTTLPRASVSKARSIIDALSPLGVDVHDANARHLCRFLSSQDAISGGGVPEQPTVGRMGWLDDERFQLGSRTILHREPGEDLDRAVESRVEGGHLDLTTAYQSQGSLAGWTEEVWALVERHPAVVLTIYATLAAPLLYHLPAARNFVLELYGITSSGKSTSLFVAFSAFGNPDADGAIADFNSSRVYFERRSSFNLDCPLFIDESKQAKGKEKKPDVRWIYDITSGRTRGRGTTTGIEATKPIRSVALISGEASITSYTQDGGVRARVIGLTGSMFDLDADEGRHHISRLMQATRRQHGTLAPAFIELLARDGALRARLPDRYEELCERWSSGRGRVAGRLGRNAALLELVAEIAHQYLGVPEPVVSPWATLEVALKDADSTEDRPQAALELALGWLNSEPHRFGIHSQGGDSVAPPSAGWLGHTEVVADPKVYLVHASTRERLIAAGFEDYTTIFREWQSRGWTETSERRVTQRVTIHGVRGRFLVIKASIQRQLGLGVAK